MKSLMNGLQPLGRALMLPIAVLPIAGLLLRLGQPDLLNIPFVSAAGDAIFANLGLLFAIGVATGFAADGNGAACLAGVVCFLVSRSGAEALMQVPGDALSGVPASLTEIVQAAWKQKAIARLDVPLGILSGLAAGLLYNRFSAIRLPDYLAFFGGRRFVPIVCGLVGLVLAGVVGTGYAAIGAGVDHLSDAIVRAGPFGLFLFGLANRLLLVTGLHHILNNVVWFVLGDYHGATGDLRRFFAGDPTAGAFMSGFFPVMMFGLPAACLAMYHTARPERRKAVGGMLLSLALTSMLTGVTEPIEFSFMFLAPVLFAVHAVLTGLSMALMNLLNVHLGFGFSAGLLDYLLNIGKATNPLLLIPVGLAYAAIYYTSFRFVILKLDLATPGREPEDEAGDGFASASALTAGGRGASFVAALGGAGNLTSIGACTTRLRLTVRDNTRLDEAALKALGARGVIRPSATAVQIVLGPMADQVAVEMRAAAAQGSDAPAPEADASAAQTAIQPVPQPVVEALGGGNALTLQRFHGRIRVTLRDQARVDHAALLRHGVRHIAEVGPDKVDLLIPAEF
ncbi:N-acetylglucosamine-specific PTS transporter subunit IIBC [Novosphingobium terrae]|uniref:N-acetylglucosamine-specific PTS transporter subunit IIBC n=1 Tax=Novosphingobium terrae TaxID=2726189 RepID=UPI0019815ACB|nr:N-acetylglucosamine-specific PTS transporter subunit IIBC [Novosphingobium terrae]